ncbi:phage tail tube protein [Streptomyces sp. NPDC020983]|uniref:phage tail tube protein n=1 Tax=Streptomyces sp. NPDC020983 TaxID=3365106 RepID=UPI0037B638A5
MSAQKYDARDCEFEVESDTPGTWVAIGGINTFTKSRSSNNADTTTFASNGDDEQQIMSRGKSMKLGGFRLMDPDTGALDAGQAIVEAWADDKSDDSLRSFRFAAPGDTTWEVWTATAELDDEGGGSNDKVSWGVTITRSGASTTAAKS